MTIVISNLRKPGIMYDSSKLNELGNMISGSVQSRTNSNYLVHYKITKRSLQLLVKKFNPDTGLYNPAVRDEQEQLAAKVSEFLNKQGVVHDVSVR